MESNNKNIVVTETPSSSTELKKFVDFNRVNFNTPSTIPTYGADVTNKIEGLVASIVAMLKEDVGFDPEFERKTAELPNLGDYLEKSSEDKKNLALAVVEDANATPIQRAFNKVGRALSGKNPKEGLSYIEVYRKFEDAAKYIESSVKAKMNDTTSDAQIYDSFLVELEKYEDQLNRLIQTGYEDKDLFVSTEIADLEKRIAETNDEDLMRELNVKKSLVETFENKLQSLRGHQSMINISREQIQLQQLTAYNQVIKYDEYVKSSSKSLMVQGLLMTRAVKQADQIADTERLVERVNLAMRKNSDRISENVAKAVKANSQDTITPETLSTLYDGIQKGIQAYKEGVKMNRENRILNDKKLTELEAQLENAKKDTIQLPDGIFDGYTDSGYQRTMKPSSKQSKGLFGRFGK